MDRLKTLQAALIEQLEAMSTQDRNLLTGLICVVALIFAGVVTYTLQGVITSRAASVIEAKESLVLTQQMAQEYASLRDRIEAAEARMATFRPTQVSTYVETWATTAGVAEGLKEVRETGNQAVGAYRERDYKVDLQRQDLDGVVKFLYAIETSQYPVEIRSAKFRVMQTRDDRFIDLGLELVTYSKEEEEG